MTPKCEKLGLTIETIPNLFWVSWQPRKSLQSALSSRKWDYHGAFRKNDHYRSKSEIRIVCYRQQHFKTRTWSDNHPPCHSENQGGNDRQKPWRPQRRARHGSRRLGKMKTQAMQLKSGKKFVIFFVFVIHFSNQFWMALPRIGPHSVSAPSPW